MSLFKLLGNLGKFRNMSKACARNQAAKELDGCFKPENLSLYGEQSVGGYHNPYLGANVSMSDGKIGGYLIPVIKDNTGKVIRKDLWLPRLGSDGASIPCDIKERVANALTQEAIEAQANNLQTLAQLGAAGAGVAALVGAASQGGCSSKPDPQEFYDVFDAAQIEGDLDPWEVIERAKRQHERNQRKGQNNCKDCKYQIREAGFGRTYGETCGGPPSDFTPPYYSYPGYMELIKTCGDGPPIVVERWTTREGGPTRVWRNGGIGTNLPLPQ